MTKGMEPIESVRDSRGMYCLYSMGEPIGEVRNEWLSRMISELPELIELLEELIDPDKEADVDTCNYVRKKLKYLKERNRDDDEKRAGSQSVDRVLPSDKQL